MAEIAPQKGFLGKFKGTKGGDMAKIKFVSKTVKEKELLSKDRLPINKFNAWQIDKGERISGLRNVLRKYIEGAEMLPNRKDFHFLDYHLEQTSSTERIYFNPSRVLSVFRKMPASEISKMFHKINDEKKKLRANVNERYGAF